MTSRHQLTRPSSAGRGISRRKTVAAQARKSGLPTRDEVVGSSVPSDASSSRTPSPRRSDTMRSPSRRLIGSGQSIVSPAAMPARSKQGTGIEPLRFVTRTSPPPIGSRRTCLRDTSTCVAPATGMRSTPSVVTGTKSRSAGVRVTSRRPSSTICPVSSVTSSACERFPPVPRISRRIPVSAMPRSRRVVSIATDPATPRSACLPEAKSGTPKPVRGAMLAEGRAMPGARPRPAEPRSRGKTRLSAAGVTFLWG